MSRVLGLVALALGGVLVLGIALVVATNLRAQSRRDRRERPAGAWAWAARRGITLTERSAPFVETYIRNARSLRIVCSAGGIAIAFAFGAGTGIDTWSLGILWVIGGYLIGSVWGELSSARVPGDARSPATPARRSVPLARWVRRGRIALPLLVIAITALALAVDGLPRGPSAGIHVWTGGVTRVQVAASAVLALGSLAATSVAQRLLSRRPPLRAEPELVAADDAMRTGSVHLLGITHIMLCLLLALPGLLYLGAILPWGLSTLAAAGAIVVVFAVPAVWSFRTPAPSGSATQPPRSGEPVRVAEPHPAAPPVAAADAGGPAPAPEADEWGRPSWRAPKRPDLVAAAVLFAVCGALLGLRWWGPVNPDVAAFAVVPAPAGAASPLPGPRRLIVLFENRSLLPVEVVDVAVVGWPSTPVIDTPAGGGPGAPIRVEGRSTVTVSATLTPPACPEDFPGAFGTWAEPVKLSLRTHTGRLFSLVAEQAWPSAQIQCEIVLPKGPQPADPVAAEWWIRATFTLLYGDGDFPEKAWMLDRADGLDGLATRARDNTERTVPGGVEPIMTRVSFDRPDHAWFVYEWHKKTTDGQTGELLTVRRGEAVLIDNVWRITRATLCADLALTVTACPE